MHNLSASGVSIGVHACFLLAMIFIRWTITDPNSALSIETFFNDETPQELVNQQLTVNTEVSQSLSFQAGGVVSTTAGGSGSPAAAVIKIEQSETLTDPFIPINVGQISMPGINSLADDLGEMQIQGETGSRVDGYGAAMSRLTHEIVRMMRKQPLHVVWLFDESKSLEDDRREISEQFDKVYEELRIADTKKVTNNKYAEPIVTSILSFGEKVHEHTTKPTHDIQEIRSAIGKVPVDESGKELLFSGLLATVSKYGELAFRQQRKLAIIVVTDESGDDGDKIEEVVQATNRFKSPIYIMSRESVFGFPFANESWVDPETKLSFPVRVNRGPESPLPECLQYDGFHERWDSYSAGFGPYELTRLCKESGGIFFILGSEQSRLSGAGSDLPRVFDQLAMKEYEPELESRRDYEKERVRSKLRQTVWDVIVELNPFLNEEIRIKEIHYPLVPQEFNGEGQQNFNRCLEVLKRLNLAIANLEKVKDLRKAEESQRWRANFDLVYAQLLTFRVRVFQAMLALDNHAREPVKIKSPLSNHWNLTRVQNVLAPTEQQLKLINIDMQELHQQEQQARKLLTEIEKEHPGTPWAQRAQQELRTGFGMTIQETFVDPKYYDETVRARIPKF